MKITSLALLCGFNEAKRFSFVDHPTNCRAAGVDVLQEGLDHTNCNSSSKRCSLVCKTTEGFQRVGAGNFRCRKNNHTGKMINWTVEIELGLVKILGLVMIWSITNAAYARYFRGA